MDPVMHPAAPLDRLRIAIDAEAVRAALDTDPADPVRAVTIRRVFVDRTRDAVVLYGIERETSGSGEWFGRLVADPHGEAERLRERLAKRRRDQESRSDPAVPIRVLADPGLVLHPTGVDEALPGLGILRKPWRLPEHLAEHGIAQLSGNGRIDLLAHRLGRRCVLRYRADHRDGRRSLIVKLFAKPERAQRAHAQLHGLRKAGFASGPVRVPEPLATIEPLQALVMEDVPGHGFPAPSQPLRASAAFRAGEALARLHALPAVGAPGHDAGAELAVLDPWCTLVAGLRPDLAGPIERARNSVALALRTVPDDARVLLHRDYYDRQLLLGERTLWLLDLDTQAAGPSALDLGNFLAHLDLADAASGPRRIAAAAETEAFLAGYGTGPRREPSPRAVEIWRRAARLRIACIHVLTTAGRNAAERLLASFTEPFAA